MCRNGSDVCECSCRSCRSPKTRCAAAKHFSAGLQPVVPAHLRRIHDARRRHLQSRGRECGAGNRSGRNENPLEHECAAGRQLPRRLHIHVSVVAERPCVGALLWASAEFQQRPLHSHGPLEDAPARGLRAPPAERHPSPTLVPSKVEDGRRGSRTIANDACVREVGGRLLCTCEYSDGCSKCLSP
jgi:hypothetical protein